MSASPVAPVAGTPVPAKPKQTAVQILRGELAVFLKQEEQAIANVHAVKGAIQAAQHLIGKLEAEAAAAEAEAKKLFAGAEAEVSKVANAAGDELKKI